MSKVSRTTDQATTYEAMRTWYLAGGRHKVSRRAKLARAAGRAVRVSLVVDSRLLDEPVTY